MSNQNLISSLLYKTAKVFLAVKEKEIPDLKKIKRVLVVRQHNQFGDLLASVSLFRAIKETIPNCRLTVITSPQNFYAVSKNKFIDEQFVFDKKQLTNPEYVYKFMNLLRNSYDLAVVPVTVAISTTSCFISRLARAKYNVGPASLDGKENKYAFLFNKRIDMNWTENPKRHVSDFGLDILRPLGITTNNYKSEITFDETDALEAEQFIKELDVEDDYKIVGLHIGAGKPPNRWSTHKFAALAELINKNYKVKFYLTGSSSDENELNEFVSFAKVENKIFMNRSIPQLAALISKSDLFITNDTGVMHVAGAVDVPQISLFGPTNPNNWAPIGENKIFLKKSDSINDISIEEVYNSVEKLLRK